MNKGNLTKWIDAILYEEEGRISDGSFRTLQMIKAEINKPDESTMAEGQQQGEGVKEGVLFRVTAKNTFPDPTIFCIKSVNNNEVVVAWQDIHGRGERTTHYVLSDVKSKFKFGDWTEVKPMEEISSLKSEVEKYVGITEAFMKVCKELIPLREFVAEVAKGQQGELKGSFIIRITNAAKKLNKEPEAQASVARDGDSSTFADTINFLEKIDSFSMSDKTWLLEQKNLRQEGKELRERLTGREIEEVKIKKV